MINIRPIQESDLQELSEIFAEVYRVFDVGERWTKETAHGLLSHWVKSQPDLAFAAEFEDKLVGAFVSGIKPWWDGNHLFDGEIFVHPEYQQHGIGKELLKTVFETAIEKYNVTVWDAFTFNKTNFPLSWYKSLGFEEIKEWTMFSGSVENVLDILERK